MATKLFRLVMHAETQTDTVTKPNIQRFFYELDDVHRVDDTITIPAAQFTNDAGEAVTELATVTQDNGYYLLFVNGLLQQTGLYTVEVSGQNLVITDAALVPVGAPVVLVVNNFVPESTSTTTISS